MRYVFPILMCALAMPVFPVAGCSDVSGSGAGGSAGDGGSTGDGGSGGGGDGGTGGTSTVPLTVQVFETNGISATDLGPGLEGVNFCEDGTDNCALTDDSGSATIMLPANQEVGYTMTKDGYISYLAWDVTDETFVGSASGWPMLTDAQMEELADHLEIDHPLQSFLILGPIPPRAGATFELMGETATGYYLDEDGVVQLDLTETTWTGRGGFLDLGPGQYEVEFGGAVANCTPLIALDSDTPNRITVTIREGYHTYATMNCDSP